MKRMLLAIVPLFMVMAAMSGGSIQAQDATTLQVVQDPALGAIFAGEGGKTVYLFTKDTEAGVSSCYDDCAVNWPPVTSAAELALPAGDTGTLGTIERTDGVAQVTYNEIPLYYWLADTEAGQTTGQGVGGVWFVVSPGSALGEYAAAPGDGTPVPASSFMIGFTAELGPFLVDASGMTVYLFTKDTEPGVSACYDDCATNWPPVAAGTELLLPAGVPGALASIERTDGTMQATYNGMPLYYFASDAAAGDTTGQAVGDVWYIVPPAVAADMATPAM